MYFFLSFFFLGHKKNNVHLVAQKLLLLDINSTESMLGESSGGAVGVTPDLRLCYKLY